MTSTIIWLAIGIIIGYYAGNKEFRVKLNNIMKNIGGKKQQTKVNKTNKPKKELADD
jgi:uncharacterized protein YneF (UPF0154 family)